mmetsp:Transcript_37211/g.55459  ORF Transcript_37211/g.55459 Transcript_37211/m.55459 type:complete len:97 (+) Transcript_37211:940-1230(+)
MYKGRGLTRLNYIALNTFVESSNGKLNLWKDDKNAVLLGHATTTTRFGSSPDNKDASCCRLLLDQSSSLWSSSVKLRHSSLCMKLLARSATDAMCC